MNIAVAITNKTTVSGAERVMRCWFTWPHRSPGPHQVYHWPWSHRAGVWFWRGRVSVFALCSILLIFSFLPSVRNWNPIVEYVTMFVKVCISPSRNKSLWKYFISCLCVCVSNHACVYAHVCVFLCVDGSRIFQSAQVYQLHRFVY